MPIHSRQRSLCLFFTFVAALCFPVWAAAEAPEIELHDFQVAGDGITPSFLQYLDTQKFQVKEPGHLLSATSKGDVTYSFDLELPPALLKPSLALAYSAEAGMSIEAPYGWELRGIPEIRRPLSSAYTLKEKDDWYDAEWLIAAPGISGSLKPSDEDDWRFYPRSSDPGWAVATYDDDADEWTVASNGITITLKARDKGADYEAGTALWRASQMQDASGNYVSYVYYSGGRIKAICYGGNLLKTGKDHLVDVKFEYETNSNRRTSARAGFLTTYRYHVTKITVGAHDDKTCASGNSTSKEEIATDDSNTTMIKIATSAASAVTGADYWYAYDLNFTETDGLDLFTTLEREGSYSIAIAGGRLEETIAEFAYSPFNDGDTPKRTDRAPAQLGLRNSRSSDDHEESTSKTVVMLTDVTGDGLPDVIDCSDATSSEDPDEWGSSWEVSHQAVDHDARTFAFEEARVIHGRNVAFSEVTTERGDKDNSSSSLAQTSRQMVDFDGDGYMDVVESGDEDEWVVYYGNSTHTYIAGEYSIENPPSPWEYSQVSWALKVGHSRYATSSTVNYPDIAIGMMDFNGDGWMDLYNPAEAKVWLHGGERKAGWTKSLSLSRAFVAMRSVEYTLASEIFKIEIDEDYCEDEASPTCEDSCQDAQDECEDECEEEVYTDCDAACEDVCDQYDDNTDLEDECKDACEDNCITDYGDASDCKDACDMSECYRECLRDFIEECADSDSSERSKYISATRETAGLYDMNGDGLPDMVEAGGTSWKVYLNTGYDFLDAVRWSAPSSYIQQVDEGRPEITWKGEIGKGHEYGKPARVYQTLLDVDGDGLPDLVMGKDLGSIYYKNTGTGFESASRSLPGWWPDDFTTSESKTDVDGDDNESKSETKITGVMLDIDHDGALDYVYRDDSGSGVEYGPYPKPNMLIKVKNGQGGMTTVDYRSLATVRPSGDWDEEQKTPYVKHLADVISSTDNLTGQTAETSFSYSDGQYEDGVFEGFRTREVRRKINDHWAGKSEFKYELDRDFGPLITAQKTYVDANLSFGDRIKKDATPSPAVRYTIETTYGDYGGNPGASYRLPSSRTITEHGEVSGSKDFTQNFIWDDYGNLTQYKHDGGGDSSDAVMVNMSYVADAADERATLFRMNQKGVRGVDPLSGASRLVETKVYYYDSHTDKDDRPEAGLLTKTETWAGYLDGGEKLDNEKLYTEFGRGPRGELSSVADTSSGLKIDQTFGFGGAVLETQTNGLGHSLTREIDARGRVKSITDDNGLKILLAYDAFNRVTKKRVTGTDGNTYTDKTTAYSRSSTPYSPYYDAVYLYDESGASVSTSYAVQDGFGRVAQVWTQDADGDYLETTEIFDLRGLSTGNSHPEGKGSTFLRARTMGISSALKKSYYDALGNVREGVADAAKGIDARLVYFNVPRVELRKDEEGYYTRLTHDAHGRVIMVEQSRGGGSYTTTGKYSYDPLGRLVKFTDGGGVYYTYSYDGGGRLRKVSHGKSGSEGLWYTYAYQGRLRSKMTDAAGLSTAWEYDAGGRVTKMTVSDSLPSATDDLVYEWDYDDKWVGSVYKTKDPAGETTLDYDVFGRVNSQKRSYNDTTTSTLLAAGFTSDIDLRGNVTARTFPSSRILTSDYDYGYLTKTAAKLYGSTEYEIGYVYDKWGLVEAMTSSLGHTFTTTRTTPLWPDEIAFFYGTDEYTRQYVWHDNGQLWERTQSLTNGKGVGGSGILAGPGMQTTKTHSYSYDGLKQLQGITKTKGVGGSDILAGPEMQTTKTHSYSYDELMQLQAITEGRSVVENYGYDAAGNLTTSQDSTGATWTHGSAGELNQVSSLTSDKGGSETLEFDKAGRVKTWTSAEGTWEFYYDGMGRLRGFTDDGAWVAVYDYDAGGELTRTGDNNPFTASPSYVFSFDAWRYDEKTGTTTEFETPLTASETDSTGNVTQHWLFREYDGHVALDFDDSGTLLSSRTLGAYGAKLSSSGTTWDWNSFHGSEEKNGLLHMGRRHLIPGRGHWLQPEPLLYEGIPLDALADPLRVATYRYARNTPMVYTDKTGNFPSTMATMIIASSGAGLDQARSDPIGTYMTGLGNYLNNSVWNLVIAPTLERAITNSSWAKENPIIATAVVAGLKYGDEHTTGKLDPESQARKVLGKTLKGLGNASKLSTGSVKIASEAENIADSLMRGYTVYQELTASQGQVLPFTPPEGWSTPPNTAIAEEPSADELEEEEDYELLTPVVPDRVYTDSAGNLQDHPPDGK